MGAASVSEYVASLNEEQRRYCGETGYLRNAG